MKNNLSIVGVIPARYESTRLTHKLLRLICGKSLLQWTWENASSAYSLDKLIIACDHSEIKEEAEKFGAEVVLTSLDHSSGTDRIAEALRDIGAKIVMNIQADEPLIHRSVIDSLAQEMTANSDLVMATAKKRIEKDSEVNNPNVVKVVTTRENFAIYFSRSPIPFYRQPGAEPIHYKHLGVYAYTKDFLYTFKNLPRSFLEGAEKLEQLRAIESGYKIKVIETQFDSCGVDTEEDFQEVKQILEEKENTQKE
ncbi:MAG: 3-deoxy-manno-octulosonate cytidylyltransferase [Candidatus Omnitrophica bacterium]|nr:3-deoxy-manno-octulosonate cytidylyltransferase [Candidatus Omnitrophota bacterium]